LRHRDFLTHAQAADKAPCYLGAPVLRPNAMHPHSALKAWPDHFPLGLVQFPAAALGHIRLAPADLAAGLALLAQFPFTTCSCHSGAFLLGEVRRREAA